jgi:hypothetical protein
MSRHDQQLDVLLGHLREVHPVISSEATRSFVRAHLQGSERPYESKTLFIPHPIIITGGVMAVITAIILVIGLFSSSTQEADRQSKSAPPQMAAQRTSIDDSTLRTKLSQRVQSENVLKNEKEMGIRKQSEFSGTISDKKRLFAPLDTTHLRELHDTVASWTHERIQGCSIYSLERSELESLGFRIESDGTIYAPGLPMGMRENHEKGMISYRIGGLAHGADSARIVQHFADLEKADKSGKKSEPSSVSRPRRVSSPVLVTNSRGREMMHQIPSNAEKSGKANLGSGIYSGSELIPIRVQVYNETLPAAEKDYYYIFWFEPTEDFIATLPLRVRQELRRSDPEHPGVAIAKADARRVISGALESTVVHPNPVTSGSATVEYTLREARHVAVSMYDITGERLVSIAVSAQRDSGTWQDAVSLEGIPNGYYLLAVTTDRGEQSIRPFILNR